MGIHAYDPASLYAVGVDVGGTKINAGIIGPGGETLYSVSLPTQVGESAVVEQIAIAVSRVLEWAYGSDPQIAPRGIGIGTAGQVDWQTGTIRHASDLLPGYTGTPLKALMEERFGMPVYVDNDVNVLALAELYAGAGRETRQMVCLALGTGIGGVIVNDGKIMHGQWGGAGEIGHMSVDFRGLPCICGGKGCLEAYASGTSIARRMNERLAKAGFQTAAGPRDTRDTIASWLSGDPDATAIMDEAFEALGAAIASLLHICNPELIMIGGGLVDVGEPLMRRIEEETRKRTMSSFQSGVRILPSSHGSMGGMIGAAMQLWEYEYNESSS